MFEFLKKKNNNPKGTKLQEYKFLSNSGEAKTLPIYKKYYISLTQRDGEQAIPIIKIGEKVKKGQIIAKPTSDLAHYRHSPTSGEVTNICEIAENHPSQIITNAIEITADGLDELSDVANSIKIKKSTVKIENYALENISKNELLDSICLAGVAGMGGAGFPTKRKLDLNVSVDTLIINGAECEPYITCDDVLMQEKAEQILKGAQIIAYIIDANEILVGIEDNKPKAIEIMQKACEKISGKTIKNIKICPMPTKYPMGSRIQIAHFLLGKKTSPQRRSSSYGFICHNVGTANACYEAVVLGKPLIERYMTVSGDAVNKPTVVKARVGATLFDIFESCDLQQNSNVIVGGTMMGFALSDGWQENKVTIKRETTSILGFQKKVKVFNSLEQNCIRCGQCAEACPIDLLPQQLYFYGKNKNYKKAQENRIFDCIECGLCSYVCPSDIPLVTYFKHSKGEIYTEKKKKQNSDIAQIRFENRQQRIEKVKAERKRKMDEKRKRMAEKQITKTDEIAKLEDNTKKGYDQDLIAQALERVKNKKANFEKEKIEKEKS